MARKHARKWPLRAGHWGAHDRAMVRLVQPSCALVSSLALIALVLLCGGCVRTAGADTLVKAGSACDTPAHRQFDFWIGEWDVHDAQGKLAGRNRITAIHGGCAIEEQWSGRGGVTGSSINAYDAGRHRWHQTWVDSTGGLLLLDGAWQDGRMVLRGDAPPEPGAAPALQRIGWQPLPDGRVRQLWESSSDGGATWSTVFDGYYSRRETRATSAPGRGVLMILSAASQELRRGVLALGDFLEQLAIERGQVVGLA